MLIIYRYYSKYYYKIKYFHKKTADFLGCFKIKIFLIVFCKRINQCGYRKLELNTIFMVIIANGFLDALEGKIGGDFCSFKGGVAAHQST